MSNLTTVYLALVIALLVYSVLSVLAAPFAVRLAVFASPFPVLLAVWFAVQLWLVS